MKWDEVSNDPGNLRFRAVGAEHEYRIFHRPESGPEQEWSLATRDELNEDATKGRLTVPWRGYPTPEAAKQAAEQWENA